MKAIKSLQIYGFPFSAVICAGYPSQDCRAIWGRMNPDKWSPTGEGLALRVVV